MLEHGIDRRYAPVRTPGGLRTVVGIMAPSDGGIGASRISDGPAGEMADADFSRVLVVGRSPVNRIVVSRIVERCGLKPLTEAPEVAAKALNACLPGMVVLDGGADDADCDVLLPQIAALRGRAGRAVPCVILLSTQNGMRDDAALAGMVDAVVAKPITPERLQPLIGRLLRRCRPQI